MITRVLYFISVKQIGLLLGFIFEMSRKSLCCQESEVVRGETHDHRLNRIHETSVLKEPRRTVAWIIFIPEVHLLF